MKQKYVVAKLDLLEQPGPANDISHMNCCHQDFAVVEANDHIEALHIWGKHFNTKVVEPIDFSENHTHCYIDFNEQYYIVAVVKEINANVANVDIGGRPGHSHNFIG
jgi:hypothetical protein